MNVLISSWDTLSDLKGVIYFIFEDSPDQLKLLASVPKHSSVGTTYMNYEMVVRAYTTSDGITQTNY